MKESRKIRDVDIDESNYGKFDLCCPSADGRRLKFTYPCGAIYEVTVASFLRWFRAPHYVSRHGHLQEWDDDRAYSPPRDIKVSGIRKVIRGHAIRVRMSDGTCYDVAWDTVLMACEPRYEWFGGLPDECKAQS